MKYKLSWVGLADEHYYDHIAKYCLPSWTKLPGEKYVIHDADKINIDNIKIIDWKTVPNNKSKFLEITNKTKPLNFWRKMQSQVWAARNLNDCDFLILLDTDIEVLNFSLTNFELMLKEFQNSNFVWATGRSQSRLHDSGFIVLNTLHPKYNDVINHYENIWESGDIVKLAKPYDGHAVESMFDLYPSYKIMNTDYGKGLHVYDLGFVHYGSKLPKALRQENPNKSGEELVQIYTRDKIVKKYKN
jgi:hypothetical protein